MIELFSNVKLTKIIKLMMLVIICFILQTNTFAIKEDFGVMNYTGKDIKPEMVQYYVKVINNAYSFYANDLNKTTNYIASQLESAYGQAFSVLILNKTQTVFAWNVISFGDSVVCWTNVNTYKPAWLYLLWPNTKYSGQTSDYASQYFGTGITLQKYNVIKNVISAQDLQYDNCLCLDSDLSIIQEKMKLFDGQDWSIVCKKCTQVEAESSFYARYQSKNHQWAYVPLFGPKSSYCDYTLSTNG